MFGGCVTCRGDEHIVFDTPSGTTTFDIVLESPPKKPKTSPNHNMVYKSPSGNTEVTCTTKTTVTDIVPLPKKSPRKHRPKPAPLSLGTTDGTPPKSTTASPKSPPDWPTEGSPVNAPKTVSQTTTAQQTHRSVVWTEGQQTDAVSAHSGGTQTRRKLVLVASHHTETERVDTRTDAMQTLAVYESRHVQQQTGHWPDQRSTGLQTDPHTDHRETAQQTTIHTRHQGAQVQEPSQPPQIATAPDINRLDFATSLVLHDHSRHSSQLLPTAPPLSHTTATQAGKGGVHKPRKKKQKKPESPHGLLVPARRSTHSDATNDDTDVNVSELDTPKK